MDKVVAFVTGAASGLGKGTAQYLLQHGARVLSYDKVYSPDMFLEDAHEQGIAFPEENCVFVKGDILCTNEVKNALKILVSKWGHVTAAVNCAGTACHRAVINVEKNRVCDIDFFKDLFQMNVSGTFNVTRLVAQQMAKQQPTPSGSRGIIINTSGVDAYNGLFGSSVSSASAGAIASMTLPIARDLSSLGIRVMAIAPGYFPSKLVPTGNEAVNRFISNCSIFPNRLGNLAEFEHCVEFIIENEMLNGEVIRLDAGCNLYNKATVAK